MKKYKGQLHLLLTDGARNPVDYGRSADDIPDWFDRRKFQKGQEFLQSNIFAMFCCMLSGLLCLLSNESTLNALFFTGKSGTPFAAFRRYLRTILHVVSWYHGDIFDKNTRVYNSLCEVQCMHQCSHQSYLQKKGQIVSQLDMVYTQFAFIGFGLLYPEKLGLKYTREEKESVIHFWKTIGYKLGAEDRFNLCRDSLEETLAVCEDIIEFTIHTYLQEPPSKFQIMSDALLNGVHMILPAVDPVAYSAFTHRMINLPVDTEHMHWYSYLLFKLQVFVLECLLCTFIVRSIMRPILNFLMRLNLYILQKWVFDAKKSDSQVTVNIWKLSDTVLGIRG